MGREIEEALPFPGIPFKQAGLATFYKVMGLDTRLGSLASSKTL